MVEGVRAQDTHGLALVAFMPKELRAQVGVRGHAIQTAFNALLRTVSLSLCYIGFSFFST